MQLLPSRRRVTASRPTRGGWIEICTAAGALTAGHSPAPPGAGGLKSAHGAIFCGCIASRPTRGGWIEIWVRIKPPSSSWSRPTRGGWIEIAERRHKSPGQGVLPHPGQMESLLLFWVILQNGLPSDGRWFLRPFLWGGLHLAYVGRRAASKNRIP